MCVVVFERVVTPEQFNIIFVAVYFLARKQKFEILVFGLWVLAKRNQESSIRTVTLKELSSVQSLVKPKFLFYFNVLTFCLVGWLGLRQDFQKLLKRKLKKVLNLRLDFQKLPKRKLKKSCAFVWTFRNF